MYLDFYQKAGKKTPWQTKRKRETMKAKKKFYSLVPLTAFFLILERGTTPFYFALSLTDNGAS